MNSFKENFFLLHKCTFQQHNELISILVIFLPKRINLLNTSLLSPRHGNNCSITSLWHEINTFSPCFCNRWGRGGFDEDHQEQVSLDGAFGEHVIITTGGGRGGRTHPSTEKIKEQENWKLPTYSKIKPEGRAGGSTTLLIIKGGWERSFRCHKFTFDNHSLDWYFCDFRKHFHITLKKFYLVWYIQWNEGKTRLMCPFYISRRKRGSSHVSSDFLRMKMRSRKKYQDVKSFSKPQLWFTRSFEKVQFQQS